MRQYIDQDDPLVVNQSPVIDQIYDLVKNTFLYTLHPFHSENRKEKKKTKIFYF